MQDRLKHVTNISIINKTFQVPIMQPRFKILVNWGSWELWTWKSITLFPLRIGAGKMEDMYTPTVR